MFRSWSRRSSWTAITRLSTLRLSQSVFWPMSSRFGNSLRSYSCIHVYAVRVHTIQNTHIPPYFHTPLYLCTRLPCPALPVHRLSPTTRSCSRGACSNQTWFDQVQHAHTHTCIHARINLGHLHACARAHMYPYLHATNTTVHSTKSNQIHL